MGVLVGRIWLDLVFSGPNSKIEIETVTPRSQPRYSLNTHLSWPKSFRPLPFGIKYFHLSYNLAMFGFMYATSSP